MVAGGGWPEGGRARREHQKLLDKSNKYAEKALGYLRAGQGAKAVEPSQRSIDILTRLRAEEPECEEHLTQLAGRLYEHAEMLAEAGRITEAVIVARRSLDSYVELAGGEITPEELRAHRPVDPGRYSGAAAAGPDLLRQAATIADAKSRLASLLARLTDDPGAKEKARDLGLEASETYKQLTQLNIRYQPDQLRVLSEYLRIVELTRPE
jgi:tetratricopeptide (TPR) repeat protein